MDREQLIHKWLNHELTPEEFEAFKSLDDYEELMKLSQNLQSYKAPSYDLNQELAIALNRKNETSKKRSWMVPFMKFAAVLVICLGIFYVLTTQPTSTHTSIAERAELELPDDSHVTLNALSNLTYNKNNWKKERKVNLDGEAFFKVEKGSRFEVITNFGIVSVLGTQFNIKQREQIFEVTCYEGSVNVLYKQKNTVLKKGDTFLIIDGEILATEKENKKQPSWLDYLSSFKSMPFREVIAEMERQYDVSIKVKGMDLKTPFTGSFPNNNLEVALKTISKPLQLNVKQKGQTIILTRD